MEANQHSKQEIADTYREFFNVAEELAEKDLRKYPVDKHEVARDRLEKHLIGMIELYSIRFGNAMAVRSALDFIERQIFSKSPKEDEVSHLSYEIWKDLRAEILGGLQNYDEKQTS